MESVRPAVPWRSLYPSPVPPVNPLQKKNKKNPGPAELAQDVTSAVLQWFGVARSRNMNGAGRESFGAISGRALYEQGMKRKPTTFR